MTEQVFTAIAQRRNRLKLANHLEKNVKDDEYCHSFFWLDEKDGSHMGCALGHAANAGIAGMCNRDCPNHPDINSKPHTVANMVFGENLFDRLFTLFTGTRIDRLKAIEILRNWK